MREDAWVQPSAHDWVYGRYTPLCNASLTYEASIQPTDSLARIFTFIFWSACLEAIYTMPTYSGSTQGGMRQATTMAF